jgi:protein-disulfide isomerase
MYRIAKLALPLMLLVVVAAAQTKPADKKADTKAAASAGNLPSEETVNNFLQQTFGYDSTLTWRIVEIRPSEVAGMASVQVIIQGAGGAQNAKLYISPDGKYAFPAEPMPFGDKPFADTQAQLLKGINGPTKGPANAAVTIVEFSDLQCPHCKDAAPIIDKLLAEEPNARFVFQHYPLPSHNWAKKAASYADCVGRASNEAVWTFIQKTFDAQSTITEANADEKLTAIANDAGAKGGDIAACAAKPETASRIEHSLALGRDVGVSGTPTVYINGRKVGSVTGTPPESLKQLVEFAAKQ